MPKTKKISTVAKAGNGEPYSKESLQRKVGSSSGDEASFLIDSITDAGWKKLLSPVLKENTYAELSRKVYGMYKYSPSTIFPAKELIFNAFNKTPLNQVKIVILGQDPYHDDGQAHGLSFSVQRGVAIPPSLRNIFKELTTDIRGFKSPEHGCLEKWAESGVLLLNATLTVEAHKANSHAKMGWQAFTDRVIKLLSDKGENLVFILWGGFAQKKKKLIDVQKHCVIETAHPSPLSCTKFYGCKCFSRANDALIEFGKSPVDWTL